MANYNLLHLLLLLLANGLLFRSTTYAVDFVFNGFNSSNLLLYGNATLVSGVLTLTNVSHFHTGRALYTSKIPTRIPNSSIVLPFYTSFIFSIEPNKDQLSGHGFVFIFAPHIGIDGTSSSQNLGLFNQTDNGDPNNHVLGVEFDVFRNQEFSDVDDNHVGIDVNSLTSVTAATAGYWGDKKSSQEETFHELKLKSGVNYQVWIDYSNSLLNVTMVRAGLRRPQRPLISIPLNLSDVLLDEMYVGFTAATGQLVEYHRILSWSFSNSKFSIGDSLVTSNLPSFVHSTDSILQSNKFIAGIIIVTIVLASACCAVTSLLIIKRRRRKMKQRREVEEWELEYWPHRVDYQEIHAATKGFSEENVIGFSGNGKVYKGVLTGGEEVAVKRILNQTGEGMKEFLAELSSLGRLRHRNLVRLRGWCKRENESLILLYDYMENGSLDKRVFDECDESLMLGWEERLRVLKDVAAGVLYLHEGWEARVLHRDIKASNVLLDREMNGRLGDFGLAYIHGRNQVAATTRVVGTVGYMAPELVRSGRASTQTDVFCFGVLILEVVCGRRPIQEGKPPLVDWVEGLVERGELPLALDKRLMAKERHDVEEIERVLRLGLLCASPDPHARPKMRQVVKVLEGRDEAEESDQGQGMEIHLLGNMNSTPELPEFRSLDQRMHYPFRQSLSSSISVTTISGSILEGR
ncbi:PREDICTED: L-type lectin-domain containing receptor kinase VII.1-like [Nelumbo nucifera]|uniref:non-specific serine/threonine protein kinase n=2 Tax=Nelumbo nucifera TaxID=4432 RepID=A0A822XL01_NELNU|nr:PREDICTED: L-type lectin-domain containing receptor kinase VII.1-like [Nelumbo nucifera]DAD20957.1 TPA_asm: hypothetical protein HUJ06_022420 [Nelumbo nucifera]